MNTFTPAIDSTSRTIHRAATNLISRFTRKDSIKLAVTISLPQLSWRSTTRQT